MTTITVRDVSADAFREFKAEAIRQKMTVGTALTLAMERFRADVKKRVRLSDFPATDWGKGNERVSENVDEILYGDS
ncbi:MAG TPA: hypothetical protein VLJ21_04055 [Candidatus Binatia bacterium]|nr:hypothetical protein [Candidatus Binatia bacterium]